MFTFFASEPQYVDHLMPIWRALEPEERGPWHVTRLSRNRVADLGVTGAVNGRPSAGGGPVVVAAFSDLRVVRARPVVFVEHGSGQTYQGVDHGSYSGGPEREGVVLYLAPNERVHRNNVRRYPDVPSAVVGAPKLDLWHLSRFKRSTPPVVAVSFHWRNNLVPESSWAFPHYGEATLEAIARQFPGAIGHAHPRVMRWFEKVYRRCGIEPVPLFDDVLARADVYVCDNSSTMYEYASTNRPVVALNAPWYRRDVEHGLRFWDAVPGVETNGDTIELTLAAIERALAEWPEDREKRARAVEAAYAYTDGKAARRAVEAMREVADVTTPERFERGRNPKAPRVSRVADLDNALLGIPGRPEAVRG